MDFEQTIMKNNKTPEVLKAGEPLVSEDMDSKNSVSLDLETEKEMIKKEDDVELAKVRASLGLESNSNETSSLNEQINSASSLSEMYKILQQAGNIQGSEKNYSADEVWQNISAYINNQADEKAITRMGGLRDKIVELKGARMEKLKKEAILNLEDDSLKLHLEEKVNIILATAEMKPATTMLVKAEDLERVKNIAKNLGLESIITEKYKTPDADSGKTIEVSKLILSKRKEIAQQVVDKDKYANSHPTETLNNDQNQKIQENSGDLYGYPKTAIDAFKNKDARLEMKDLPKEIKDSEIGQILNRLPLFVKSKAHWQEELVIYESWFNKIKEVSPKIYQQVLEMDPIDDKI